MDQKGVGKDKWATEQGEIARFEGVAQQHGHSRGKGERGGGGGWMGAWRQIESRARRDCPGEHRRGCMVKITTRLRPQYVLPTLRESRRGISQRRIPRRLVDVDVVVAVSTTRPCSTT